MADYKTTPHKLKKYKRNAKQLQPLAFENAIADLAKELSLIEPNSPSKYSQVKKRAKKSNVLL